VVLTLKDELEDNQVDKQCKLSG